MYSSGLEQKTSTADEYIDCLEQRRVYVAIERALSQRSETQFTMRRVDLVFQWEHEIAEITNSIVENTASDETLARAVDAARRVVMAGDDPPPALVEDLLENVTRLQEERLIGLRGPPPRAEPCSFLRASSSERD